MLVLGKMEFEINVIESTFGNTLFANTESSGWGRYSQLCEASACGADMQELWTHVLAGPPWTQLPVSVP